MPKKIIKKKKKIRLIPFLIALIIMITLYFSLNFYLSIPTKNIIITGNNLISDQEIIDLAKLRDYPKYFSLTTTSIKKKILTDSRIKEVKVERQFFHTFKITIEEYKPIFQVLENKDLILNDGSIVGSDIYISNIPLLLNQVPEKVYNSLITGMQVVKEEVLSQISEIEYVPTYDENNKVIDSERFLFYMDDKNRVYVTLTKLENINYYSEAINKFGGQTGVWNIDSGNYFDPDNN